jgi:hypothetical protein
MLCFLCRKIQVKSTESSWTLQHHLSFADLTESAESGCELCNLFRETLIYYYSETLGIPTKAAENLHRELDSDNVGKIETDRQLFYVELQNTDADESYSPSENGASGLRFLRVAEMGGGSPVGEVYPSVHLSASSGIATWVYNFQDLLLIDIKMVTLFKVVRLLEEKLRTHQTSPWAEDGLLHAKKSIGNVVTYDNPNFRHELSMLDLLMDLKILDLCFVKAGDGLGIMPRSVIAGVG